jgi:hypothetical protein
LHDPYIVFFYNDEYFSNFCVKDRSSATNGGRSGGGRGGSPGRGGPAPEEFKTQLVKTLFDVNVTFNKVEIN